MTCLRYCSAVSRCLSNSDDYRLEDGVYVSLLNDFSLCDFIVARSEYCFWFHEVGNHLECPKCSGLVSFAQAIETNGIVAVASTFRECFPKSKYESGKAVRMLMQLPLMIVELSVNGPGTQRLYATELKTGVDARRLTTIMKQFLSTKRREKNMESPSRQKIDALCSLASTEQDRFHIKMGVTSSLSPKEAKSFGIENLNQKRQKLEVALKKAT